MVDPCQGPRMQPPEMGLKVRESSQILLKENLAKDFEKSDGRTTVMSVSTSGRTFNVKSNGKMGDIGLNEDVDESSSGYSSRESHSGEGQVARNRPQKSSKILLVKDADKSSRIKNEKVRDEKSLLINGSVVKRTVEDKGELTEPQAKPSSGKAQSYEKPKNISEQSKVDVVINKEDICLKTCSTCSCAKEQGVIVDSQKIYRQRRVEVLEDNRGDDITPDQRNENRTPFGDGDGEITAKDWEICRAFKDQEIQTDYLEPELFQECSSLKMLNVELEERLRLSNVEFDITIKRLEKQLDNATTEISHLKSQVLSTDLQSTKLSPCTKCGYHSDDGLSRLRPISSHRKSQIATDVRKASSVENLAARPKQHSVQILQQQPNLLSCIFKGENLNKVKTALLERNKSLKDEIQNLKDEEQYGAFSSTILTRSNEITSVSNPVTVDPITDKEIAPEPEMTSTTKQRTENEEVRWKQPIRILRRPKKTTTARPQFTSAAFRTIHVTKWGPQA